MPRAIRRTLRSNGLLIALFALFAVSLSGQVVAGHREFNDEQRAHGQPVATLGDYLTSGHFVEAVFENWESEFLQMAMFVLLTAVLRQKGSPESRKLDEREPVDADPRLLVGAAGRPWPVRRGGMALALYEHSLSLALGTLFVLSFLMHAYGGVRAFNADAAVHGGASVSFFAYIATARFWFESFQNWQSEFLSVGVLVVLSIVLRERGSPQSKPVAASHGETGQAEDEPGVTPLRPLPPGRGRRKRRGLTKHRRGA